MLFRSHPDRFFNLGIAEKNMITVAAGLAASGQVVYAATFASFCALLGAEQIRTDCAYPGMPVRVVGHHSGMSMGFYGTSHHSLEDIGMMRTIADLTVVCVSDANHLRGVLRASVDHPGAMYIRLGRGRDPQVYDDVPSITFGRAIRLREGRDVALIVTGTEVHPALAAAELYASVLPDSRIDGIAYAPADSPFMTKGDVMSVQFTVLGQPFVAINGGAQFPFTEAVSFQVHCEDQAEVDRIWAGLLADGGAPSQCGWLKDRFGLSWQVIPKALMSYLEGPDPAGSERAMQEMLTQSKLDIEAIRRAYAGEA